MKKLLFFALIGIAATAFAQDKPIYDEALAKKLGADEHGMKNYVLVILKTGDKVIDQAQRTEIFAGHMKNIQKMASEGKLAVAGPFGDNSNNYRGLYIFNVTTIDEAKALAESDPAVKSGMMKAEYYLWYGTAAMIEVNGIHAKIAKKPF
ncbi:MAG: hypothetical protein EOO48_08755 [Flavobacterium sp.]|nr:MAG: hypothetical protein EOO48_08755 [Flavobacterium sp.]